ncbi:MAG TPA: extracellular solute-binding protein [Tepidisphaeraceae bacterium]|nr:extracellular solute-binding protein [Tepidisphaeraceae bacterium]
MIRTFITTLVLVALLACTSCSKNAAAPIITVYCAVDEPYASKIFAEFEKETGIRIAALYDIESSKSVGLAGKLEAERDHPQADVWWGSEAFLTARLAEEGVLAPYASSNAADIPAVYKDKNGRWAGVGLRARVIALGVPPPDVAIQRLEDLTNPKLKNKIAIARPTAGATGAHVTALYLAWGQDKGDAFFRGLHDNGVALLGGNAEVADQVGAGSFEAGLTDTDDVVNSTANGGKLSMVVPDQGANDAGTMTMPTTVGLVTGSKHAEAAKRLIDYLLSRQTETRLEQLNFVKWSVRDPAGAGGVKAMTVDYAKAAENYAASVRRATALLEGRPIE